MADGACSSEAEHFPSGTMRCPVCRASQVWADVCRRCHADLSLLRETARRREHRRAEALQALRDGDVQLALRRAREVYRIHPDAASGRLLLACRLATAVADA